MNSSVLSTPSPTGQRPGDSSGGLLLESGKISPENAERVLRMQKELGIRFGEAAQRLGLITEADIQQVLARQFDYPYLQKGESKLLAAAGGRLRAVQRPGGNPARGAQPADAALVRQPQSLARHQ
jgi:hypothetical protein